MPCDAVCAERRKGIMHADAAHAACGSIFAKLTVAEINHLPYLNRSGRCTLYKPLSLYSRTTLDDWEFLKADRGAFISLPS